MSDSLQPGESPGLLLWRTTLAWQRAVAQALRPHGLTHVQFVLLASAWWLVTQADEQPSQRRLAEYAETDPMMTSQVLRALEARGLVARHTGQGDARTRIVTITPDGERLARETLPVVEAVDAAFFARAGDPAQVLGLLHRLSDPVDAD